MSARGMLALLALLVASDATVTFEVRKGGDVKWRAAPCTVEVRAAGGDGAVVAAGVLPAPGARLAAGKYDALLTCDSDDGPVRKGASFTVRADDMKVTLSLDPGFLIVDVLRFDTPVTAELTVFDESGREIARSKERAVLPLTQGKVRLLARVEASSFVGGELRPVFATAVATIISRQKTSLTLDTTDGELTVLFTDNGMRAGGIAALRASGQTTRLVELRAGEKASVPPGIYDLVSQLDGTHDFSEVVTKDITIAPQKVATRTIAHRTGTVRATVLINGKRPPPEAVIEIELQTPGSAQPFNTVAIEDLIKLAPGPVVLTAKRSDALLDDGSHASAVAKVVVAAGALKSVTLDLVSSTLEVTTSVGGKPRALEVALFATSSPAQGPQGGDVPVAKKSAGPDGKVRFVLPAGRLWVTATLKAPQGDVVTQRSVALPRGGTLGTTLNLDLGTVVVQVFQAGVAVPGRVRFCKKQAPACSEPVLEVPAGQEAVLPPGIYGLTVLRKGEERSFSDLKVAAGRTVERTVEFAPLPAQESAR